jgi:hypothetical protein
VILSAVAPCDESDPNPTTPKTNILPDLFVAVPEPAGRPVGTTTVLVDTERGVAGTFGPRFVISTAIASMPWVPLALDFFVPDDDVPPPGVTVKPPR